MPRSPAANEARLNNVSKCVAITANTLDVLVDTLKISGLEAISNTVQSLLGFLQTIKQDKDECAELMEHTHELLKAIIGVYIKSDTGPELPPSILNEIAKFIETLHKIHTFVEAQQSGSKIKNFFRQGELSVLLKDCKAGLQQGLDFFNIKAVDIMTSLREMQDQDQLRHQEILDLIKNLSSPDSAASMYSSSYASSNSISMLPAEPKIFHGRDSELADILTLFRQGTPRIAILGAGGIGKTTLARIVVHHEETTTKYHGNRFFVTCDTASSKPELAGLIGAHLGLKPGKDLTRAVLQHFSSSPPSLLILDNLETVWEPLTSRKEIEEFLSLLTDITSLALVITMRGTERPSQVQWTRPFLPSLPPLTQDAARRMFTDIADDKHSLKEVDQVLGLTGNMPLSISLLAHLVDMDSCPEILSRWETEKTSLISEGYDRRSNLELSISLSLSSSRITSIPQSQDLLALLSMLPDGLSDAELKQTKFPIKDILGCKAALLRTALAYTDDHKRLKVLVPIREYMGRLFPPTDQMIQPLLKHFHELLGSYVATDIIQRLPSLGEHRLKVYSIAELVNSWPYYPIFHPESLIAEALTHFKYFHDPDLEGFYYLHNANISTALQHVQIALSLAQSNGNYRRQSDAHYLLGQIEIYAGAYTVGQAHASEAQRLAKICGDLWKEASGLYSEAFCLQFLGDYKECMALAIRGRTILDLCGLSHGELDYALMGIQAEVHKLKSEYVEAHEMQHQILQTTANSNYQQGFCLMNVAEIEVFMGVSQTEIQKKIDTARVIFRATENALFTIACDTIQADLDLRDGNLSSTLFCKCLQLGWGNFSEAVNYCLERLADITRWEGSNHPTSWAAVFLAHSFKAKERLGIHKALEFLGDVFLREDDEVTAISLFTLALEGFTQMDVHRSRAECMIRLGDIANKHGDLLKALEFWETARPLFECSSQAKQVGDIDERLVGMGEDVKEQHKRNLAQLAELNAPMAKVEEVDENLLEDELEKEKVGLVAA
ncbi:hypothetical protein C8F04DRAFT_1234377 [Mycena alexandri]|uniref:Novel STAND NTPase 1 domain-containing protein n=1 Tax=Mycena alexandri TaxID=1745969 RepID=A0AAD6X2L7_9AGAR|nr:hypothetical protein C8F04DRAFT_1234377 [Mycena alexandri]